MLKIENLNKVFNAGTVNEVKALDSIDCDIEEGSFVALLGTNGSGKSTLLNAVAGTFFPDTGKIILDGLDVTGFPEHKRARLIGRVFQNPFTGTAPEMSIAENLTLASKRGLKRGLQKAIKANALDFFREKVKKLNMGLEDRLGTPIGKLSGGQRQALTLLMATWYKPKLLLLDEHTAALDPKTANKVIQLTQNVISRDNLTTLMVTHSMQQAVNLGDRILMMHNGKIVHDFRDADKKRLKARDLVELFDEIRRKDQIDASVAEMIEKNYV
jgi:putative ABC transport system ATP-binding protein